MLLDVPCYKGCSLSSKSLECKERPEILTINIRQTRFTNNLFTMNAE